MSKESQVGDVWKSNDGTATIFFVGERPHNMFSSVVKDHTREEFFVHDIVKRFYRILPLSRQV